MNFLFKILKFRFSESFSQDDGEDLQEKSLWEQTYRAAQQLSVIVGQFYPMPLPFRLGVFYSIFLTPMTMEVQ